MYTKKNVFSTPLNFVKSNLMRMFAIPNIRKGEESPSNMVRAFFMLVRLIYGFVPPCGVLNGPTALAVLGNGKDETVLFSSKQTNNLEMPNTKFSCLSGNNSTQQTASAHETGFQRLSSLIPNLHEAHIRYKKNRVTGVFNISGRKTTMGATSLPELIEKLLQKEAEYREYIRQNRKKREMHKNGL